MRLHLAADLIQIYEPYCINPNWGSFHSPRFFPYLCAGTLTGMYCLFIAVVKLFLDDFTEAH